MTQEIARLSPSIASTLLNKSAAHAWLQHRLLGGQSKPETPAMFRGKVLERLILGFGEDELAIVDAANWMTKDAKAAKEEARAAGKLPILRDDYSEAAECAVAVKKQLYAQGIKFAGKNQVRVEWESNGCPCSGVIDHLDEVGGASEVVFELKTTENAHPLAIQRRIFDFGIDMQVVAYEEARKALAKPVSVQHVLIFAETDKPWAVTLARLSPEAMTLAQKRWDRAKALWKECLASNNWPGYVSGVAEISPTPWQIRGEDDAAALSGAIHD